MENQSDQIQQIVNTALTNIKNATEINTIIGKPLVTSDGSTILPVSQVSFGFLAGGGEYNTPPKALAKNENQFAGGSGGGASLTPIGFLVIHRNEIKMLKINEESAADKLLDLTKELLGKFTN